MHECVALFFLERMIHLNHTHISTYLQHLFLKYKVFFLLSIFLFPALVQAEESSLNFHVVPELPASQVDSTNSYFDLNLAPGSKEKLSLKLHNGSEETIQVRITPHTAYTNVHGFVEYGKKAEEPDPTLLYSLDELIESPDVVELSGNETKTVNLSLQMPDASFDGFLAGGLRISEVKEETEETVSEQEGVAVKNEFAYVIGVVVSNTRDSVEPDLELLDVFPNQLNFRNVISATIQNVTPTFVNRLAIKASVQREGETEILYEASDEQMQMAPNSHFHFPIPLGGDRFEAGNYLLKLTATSKGESWSWEQKFTIDSEKARSYNRTDVTIDASTNWWMIGSLVLFFALLGMIVYELYKKKLKRKSGGVRSDE